MLVSALLSGPSRCRQHPPSLVHRLPSGMSLQLPPPAPLLPPAPPVPKEMGYFCQDLSLEHGMWPPTPSSLSPLPAPPSLPFAQPTSAASSSPAGSVGFAKRALACCPSAHPVYRSHAQFFSSSPERLASVHWVQGHSTHLFCTLLSTAHSTSAGQSC